MFRTIFFFLFLLSFSLPAQQNLGFRLADGKRRVQIPVEIHNNLIVVRIILNDVLPLKFVVDTGVRTTILTQKTFTDVLQLPYNRKLLISGPGGEKLIGAYVVNNVSLTLPGVTGKGHAMLVLDEDYLELRNHLGTDVHGILGYELFSRFIIQLDYKRKIMTLMLPDRFKPGKRFDVIPIRIQDTKPYMLAPVGINEEHTLNAKLLIDTGASHGLLLEPQSDSRITLPTKTLNTTIGRGLGGEITGKTGRIKSIEIGNFIIQNALANFPDSDSYFVDTLKYKQVDRNGTLGGEILSRFTVVFNFPQEKIYLKKNSDLKKSFYFNLSGLSLRAKGSLLNTFEVSELREGSVAEKCGLMKGDQLVSINGIPAKELELNQINGILNSKPGKKIRLDISRDGQKKSFEFKLEDQI